MITLYSNCTRENSGVLIAAIAHIVKIRDPDAEQDLGFNVRLTNFSADVRVPAHSAWWLPAQFVKSEAQAWANPASDASPLMVLSFSVTSIDSEGVLFQGR
jgi:hypothetical protein